MREMSRKEYWENRDKEMEKDLELGRKMKEIGQAEDLTEFADKELQLYIASHAKLTKRSLESNYDRVSEELEKRQEKNFWDKWTKEYYEENSKIWNNKVRELQRKGVHPNAMKMRLEKATGIRMEDIKKASAEYKK